MVDGAEVRHRGLPTAEAHDGATNIVEEDDGLQAAPIVRDNTGWLEWRARVR